MAAHASCTHCGTKACVMARTASPGLCVRQAARCARSVATCHAPPWQTKTHLLRPTSCSKHLRHNGPIKSGSLTSRICQRQGAGSTLPLKWTRTADGSSAGARTLVHAPPVCLILRQLARTPHELYRLTLLTKTKKVKPFTIVTTRPNKTDASNCSDGILSCHQRFPLAVA